MGTLTIAVIFTIAGLAIGAYIMNRMRKDKKEAATFDRKFNQRVPSEALTRAKLAKSGPVPSDPDVGDFLEEISQDKQPDAAATKKASKIKDKDGVELYHLIDKLGTDAWISKTTVNTELGWGFARYKMARNYLERNRYIKALETNPNRGTKYAAVK